MPDRSCVYIDGESHYIRSEKKWQKLHGASASLEQLRYKGDTSDKLILVIPKAKVFWTRRMNPGVTRTVYFSAVTCDEPELHQVKRKLRDFGSESAIFKEPKNLACQRAQLLKEGRVIEKAKQVDIALAVRMVEDAEKGAFDVFHLYTSDVDFLPAIEAVRGRGKQVFVYGHKNGVADDSQLLHVPDQFVDLGEMMQDECDLLP